jgi:hypothetical protein
VQQFRLCNRELVPHVVPASPALAGLLLNMAQQMDSNETQPSVLPYNSLCLTGRLCWTTCLGVCILLLGCCPALLPGWIPVCPARIGPVVPPLAASAY